MLHFAVAPDRSLTARRFRLPPGGPPSVLPAPVADHADRRAARQPGRHGRRPGVPQTHDRPAADQRAQLARPDVCRHDDGHTDAFQQTFPARTQEPTGLCPFRLSTVIGPRDHAPTCFILRFIRINRDHVKSVAFGLL